MGSIRLNNRGILEVTGQDRLTFLQGLVTNDVLKLASKKILYTALLSPQGKYLYDFFLIHQSDSVWIDCYQDKLSDIKRRLNLYKLRTDVQLNDLSEQIFVTYFAKNQDGLCLEDPRTPELGFRCYHNHSPNLPDGQKAYNLKCLELGIPSPEDMIEGKGIPLECGLDDLNAIAWDKGCYMGQELTARTRYRGLVRKRLLPVCFEGGELPFGSDIRIDGAKAGQMRTTQNGLGIAMIRLEAIESVLQGEAVLVCEGYELQIKLPSWIKLDLPQTLS